MTGYRAIFIDPSEFNDTELGSEVRDAWAEGVRVIELVEPRINPRAYKPLPDRSTWRDYSGDRGRA